MLPTLDLKGLAGIKPKRQARTADLDQGQEVQRIWHQLIWEKQDQRSEDPT